MLSDGAKFSSALLNQLTEFMICELDHKARSGITYSMISKDERDKETYNRYYAIKKEAINCGYKNDEVFRIYEVSNGYIFDMDLNVVRKITAELMKSMAKTDSSVATAVNKNGQYDFIGGNPEERRKNDMIRLANYVKQEFKSGNNVLEVALFSRNSVPRIVINGVGPNKELISVKYNAYAIRHFDIEAINANVLIPSGLRVYKIEPREILPSKTGVLFKLYVESV